MAPLLNAYSAMSKDTGGGNHGQSFRVLHDKKKGRVETRPDGTLSRPEVSQNYFGCACGLGAAGAVAGLAAGFAGLAAAGLAGAGTPDCAL